MFGARCWHNKLLTLLYPVVVEKKLLYTLTTVRMEIDGLTRFSDQYSKSSDFFKISCMWAEEFSVEHPEHPVICPVSLLYQLRILWCHSPYATAELFDELKVSATFFFCGVLIFQRTVV